MVLLTILAVLFIALIILVPLLEKTGPRLSPEDMAKLGRFVFPLIAILMIAQLIRYFFF